ncbi:serine aminopeptidase S33 family [Paraperlucidibaca baekdonensis]|uniref:Serine aminopeptidase S33 family n=1 Tax=Paraperlucidibaca baekdonensis TaxID=748120 RepID=A0A3E0H8U7_9GAMM|nr:alpha/beta fold hydrolase [Paraperlucidibaca baekdonensis]REH40044.1 serine aminopeptidase S33 family [Paraperlucidibaca baekdonensis]
MRYLSHLPAELPSKTPRWFEVAAEARVGLELLDGLRLRKRLLNDLPLGAGHPVMLLPGYGTSERAMGLLAKRLRSLGYVVRQWGQGKNHGAVHKLVPPLKTRIRDWSAQLGQPVSLIGWSLGGYIARELARDMPEQIAGVIALGSPVVGGPKYTLTAKQYIKMGFDLDAIERDIASRDSVPIQCPMTLIFSRVDGVVSWPATIDRVTPQARHVEARCSHLGMVFSPQVFRQIAMALADQRAGTEA